MIRDMIKISIIVPVYNVEKYIEQCVKSLLDQDIHEEYEILLIDDGSTDKSGEICDLFDREEKVRVFHKKNGGLSDARNFGIEKSLGKYIAFVDSDDIVSKNYLSILYTGIKINKVDISIANYVPFSDNDIISITNENIDTDYIVLKSKDILKSALLGKQGSLSSVAKLFDKMYFQNLKFNKGKLFEDMEIIYQIYLNSEKVSYCDKDIYFYYQRENSIVHSKITEKHLYGIKSCIGLLSLNNPNNTDLNKYVYCRIVNQACGHLPNLIKNFDIAMYKKIRQEIKPYLFKVIFGKITPFKLRLKSLSYVFNSRFGLLYAKLLFSSKRKVKKR